MSLGSLSLWACLSVCYLPSAPAPPKHTHPLDHLRSKTPNGQNPFLLYCTWAHLPPPAGKTDRRTDPGGALKRHPLPAHPFLQRHQAFIWAGGRIHRGGTGVSVWICVWVCVWEREFVFQGWRERRPPGVRGCLGQWDWRSTRTRQWNRVKTWAVMYLLVKNFTIYPTLVNTWYPFSK